MHTVNGEVMNSLTFHRNAYFFSSGHREDGLDPYPANPLLPCSVQGHGLSDDMYVRRRAKQLPCVIPASENAVSQAQTKQSGLLSPDHSWPVVFPAEQGATGPCACGFLPYWGGWMLRWEG